jgi:hypothetical protein
MTIDKPHGADSLTARLIPGHHRPAGTRRLGRPGTPDKEIAMLNPLTDLTDELTRSDWRYTGANGSPTACPFRAYDDEEVEDDDFLDDDEDDDFDDDDDLFDDDDDYIDDDDDDDDLLDDDSD